MSFHIILLLLATSECSRTDVAVKGPRDDNTTLQPSELQNASCPTWMHWNIQQGRCVCEADYIQSFVTCSDRSPCLQVGVLQGYCITHTTLSNQTLIVGSCQYNIATFHSGIHGNSFYLDLPLDPTQVERAMCGSYNRRGQLCGGCMENYSLPVYTYHPQCVECPKHTSNWGKYLAFSLLPQTVFFISVVTLRFRGMSPHVNGFILYSQLITPPPVLRAAGTLLYNYRNDDYPSDRLSFKVVHAVLTFHSVWNMDFFRLTYEPFCLHSNASALQILALDYVIAIYPLLLIVLIYALVKLYYQNWTPIVLLWKPFQRCSIWFRRGCNIQSSLIDAFATFLLLSYIKFLSVSLTFLFPALILDTKGEVYTPNYLYYASTTEYLGSKHIPYFLLAIVTLSTFTLIPILLLCLYPCQWFQRCLNKHNLSFQALHIFMDAFQGSYKNGTNGTKDYRCFAAGNLILMIAIYLSLICEMIFIKFWATISVLIVFLGALSICHPFKQDRHNKLYIIWLLLVLFFYSVTTPYSQHQNRSDSYLGSALAIVFIFIPLVCIIYFCVLFAKWLKPYCTTLFTKWRCRQGEEPGVDDVAIVSPLLNEGTVMYSSIETRQNE